MQRVVRGKGNKKECGRNVMSLPTKAYHLYRETNKIRDYKQPS